jgi:hypothetical protein
MAIKIRPGETTGRKAFSVVPFALRTFINRIEPPLGLEKICVFIRAVRA